MLQWLNDLKDAIKDLPPPARTLTTLALVGLMAALSLFGIAGGHASSTAVWGLMAALIVLFVAFLIIAAYCSVAEKFSRIEKQLQSVPS